MGLITTAWTNSSRITRWYHTSGVARGGMAPPKLLLNVFLWNELMLLRGLNVESDLGSVPEFA